MPEPTTAPVTAEDLRGRLIAVIKSVRVHPELDSAVTAMIMAGAGFHVTDKEAAPLADAVLAALAGDPGDLPAQDVERHLERRIAAQQATIGRQSDEVDRLRAELANRKAKTEGILIDFEQWKARAQLAEAERDALKAAITEAVRLINEWMTPGAPLFDPGHAAEVEALLKKTIGERTLAVLDAPETTTERTDLIAAYAVHLRSAGDRADAAKAAIERVRVLCRLKQAQAERAFTRMLSGKPFPAEVRVEAVLAALDAPETPGGADVQA